MLYEDIIVNICGKDWKSASKSNCNGGYGIAILLAYMSGIKPAIEDISKHIKSPVKPLLEPFRNLLYSGIFSKAFDARSDQELMGKGVNNTNIYETNMTNESCIFNYAWCNIAGIASGDIERVYTNPLEVS